MSDPAPLLDTARNGALPAPERISALLALRALPPTGDVVDALAAIAVADDLLAVREAALDVLRGFQLGDSAAAGRRAEALLEIVASTAVPRLRRAAGRDLLEFAGKVDGLAPFFVAALRAELDPALSRFWLEAIARSGPLAAPDLAELANFAGGCPSGLREDLLAILATDSGIAAAAGVLELLAPFEAPELKVAIFQHLERCPRLPEGAAERLVHFAERERDLAFRGAAIRSVLARTSVPVELLHRILALVAGSPDGEAWLMELRPRLSAAPGLCERIAAVASTSPRIPLRVLALRLVDPATQSEVLLAALGDASRAVRGAALAQWAAATEEPTAALVSRLAAAAAEEGDAGLAADIAARLVAAGDGLGSVAPALFAWACAERRPEVAAHLEVILLRAAREEAHRAALLARLAERLSAGAPMAGLRTLLEVLVGSAATVDQRVTEAVLRRVAESTDFEDAAAAAEALGHVRAEPLRAAEARFSMFLRFAHRHPEAPLHDFVREFKQLSLVHPAFAARLPEIARLCGEAWILEGSVPVAGGATSLLRTILDALRTPNGKRVACDLLRSAYENRTLKRSEVIALLRRLVHGTEDGLVQEVLAILGDGQLVTEEVVAIVLGALRSDPHGRFATQFVAFLERFGPRWPGYAGRLVAELTPARYAEFCRLSMAPTDLGMLPRTWNAWEYEGFRLLFRGWPIIPLAYAAGRDDALLAMLATPLGPASGDLESLHLAILDHRRPDLAPPTLDADGRTLSLEDALSIELHALAALLASVRNRDAASAPPPVAPSAEPASASATVKPTLSADAAADAAADASAGAAPAVDEGKVRAGAGGRLSVLHDRALCRFVVVWRAYVGTLRREPPPSRLADAAAHAYLDLCRLHPVLRAPTDPPYPAPLARMAEAPLQAAWPLPPEAFEELRLDHLAVASKEDEDGAAAILRELQDAVDRNDRGGAFTLVSRLLADFRPTTAVRRARAGLHALRARLMPR